MAQPTPLGRWLLLAAVIVALDQLVKAWIVGHFDYGESREVTGFFNLVRVHNSGAAFSFLAGASGWQRWFFVALGAAASVFIVWLLRSDGGRPLYAAALTAILGGAIGNVVDRLVHGHVIDFVQLHHAGWSFPAFNVADSAITVGAVLLVLDELRRMRQGR